jgi:hypothetical protein
MLFVLSFLFFFLHGLKSYNSYDFSNMKKKTKMSYLLFFKMKRKSNFALKSARRTFVNISS